MLYQNKLFRVIEQKPLQNPKNLFNIYSFNASNHFKIEKKKIKKQENNHAYQISYILVVTYFYDG